MTDDLYRVERIHGHPEGKSFVVLGPDGFREELWFKQNANNMAARLNRTKTPRSTRGRHSI